MIEDEYIYKCRPQQDLLAELFKDEFKAISKLSRNGFDPDTGNSINKQDVACQKLYNDRSQDIAKAISDDRNRVFKNMLDIRMNHTVRIAPTILVQRVPMGWIYLHETYSNQGAASCVIHRTSTFVPSKTGI